MAIFNPVVFQKNKSSGIVPVSLAITKAPTKTKYIFGEQFDMTGMKVTATLSNGFQIDIPNDMLTVSPSIIQNVTQPVTISLDWDGKIVTTEQKITVDNVLGVMWNSSVSSSKLTRLTPSSDPNELVTIAVPEEPKPAVGAENGSSPFDQYFPWAGMQRSYINGNEMVYIPQFYYKVVRDGTKTYWYISETSASGFKKHPGSDRYVSRYPIAVSGKLETGVSAVTVSSRSDARTKIRAQGDGWHQYDFATYCAILLLYLVEFADFDSQAKIGQGLTGYSGLKITVNGQTDGMIYHTGRDSGEDGKTAVQYRHIENLWGNIMPYVDGINLNNKKVYITTAPSNYKDNSATGYTNTGLSFPASSGWITKYGSLTTSDWAFIPTTCNANSPTHVPDPVYVDTGWMAIGVGGGCTDGIQAGLFFIASISANPSDSFYFGARSIYIPG